jgi:hypothetical protein
MIIIDPYRFTTYIYSSDPWIETILVDYFDVRKAYDGSSEKAWALSKLLTWLNSSYAQSTFGPTGLNKSAADFFFLIRHNGNIPEKTLWFKTGATLRHTIEGIIYDQNIQPAHTYTGQGDHIISSIDGWNSLTSFELTTSNVTGSFYYNIQRTVATLFTMYLGQNYTMSKFIITEDNTSYPTHLRLFQCGLSGIIDLRNIKMGSAVWLQGNLLITNILFNDTPGQSCINMYFYLNYGLLSLDLSNMICTGTLSSYSCYKLTSLIFPTVTVELSLVRFDDCALPISDIDAVFAYLNTFFSSNTPIKDLTVNFSGGTNGVPTDGALNTDIVNIKSIFTAAGFVFTATINT